jgi:glycosyltransferase involved in cell wall biosynthesis
MITISVVVPVYGGEFYLEKLASEIETVRNVWKTADSEISLHELILVDDDAIDRSPEIIDELSAAHPWVRAIHLGRNFGQHAATVAGISNSSGDWVVTMDEDLQHPPAQIAPMLRQSAHGRHDIVYAAGAPGIRHDVKRDALSRHYKRAIGWLTSNPAIEHASSFRLIRGSVARAAANVCGYDTYFDVALSWFTRRVGIVTMSLKDDRYAKDNRSGYNFRSLASHGRRLAASSQVKILRLFFGVGLASVLIGLMLFAFIIVAKITQPYFPDVRGWASLMTANLFFGGLTLLMLGVLMEYMSILLLRAHGRPGYFIIDRSSDERLRRYFGVDPAGQGGGTADAAAREQ